MVEPRYLSNAALDYDYFPFRGKQRLTIVANCVRGSSLGLQKFKQHLQIGFNVGKAVPGRRKCSKFIIPQLIANAMALSNREVTAYDITMFTDCPLNKRAYRSARSGSDRAEWKDPGLKTAKTKVHGLFS